MILKGKVQNEDVIELFVLCILFVSNGISFLFYSVLTDSDNTVGTLKVGVSLLGFGFSVR